MSRERNEQGQFVGTVTDEAVLDAVREVAPAPATTNDVADALDCTRKAAWEHLTALHDEERVERRKVGGRAVVWWLTDGERTRGGSAEPLRELVGLVDDEGAERVRERSREFREEFNDRMDRRRTGDRE